MEHEASDLGGIGGRAAGVIGVVGAGTMGAGIAQLACRSGARTLLHDPFPEALERGVKGLRAGLEKEAAKGKLTAEQAREASERLEPMANLDGLASCELVIEAAPERLDVKHELYGRLSEIVSEECVLASNTSSLPITAIAAGATHPERVVGMHFFNPAPLMRLLEVVAGLLSGERALAIADATGLAMGKDVIRAADGPGFLVNRCNRPFGLEALRLLAERIADVPTIDRVVRMGGGFRMGPFELSDLVGVDVGFDVSKSFYELSFGEPRWRPSPIQARQVAAGLHGRKSGRGYYDYSGEGPHRPADPDPPQASAPVDGEGLVVICGHNALAEQLREAAGGAGFEVRSPHDQQTELPALVVECGDLGAEQAPRGGARLVLCDRGSLATLDPGGPAVGFHALPPFGECRLVELTRSDSSSPAAVSRAERFFAALGKHVEWVGDAPGLVLGRIVCQVINESAFALGEGVGSAQDIDTGMLLGMAHPRGPIAWAREIGVDHVLAVLGGLWEERREERYRPAPALTRCEL
ncbi:MAG TPA: 3-hydroxyacyl-CoA dehydrogenase NAD-binding domain-containing protein [Solirubrobacteraceae bacterium]|jgi:3-hydroxybutyryl-CoA dehydrogenase|nr:3-hydroxyacyl-CoA dehydrogenase NAD-binding domain-containing protein [Solirubrobacteraceae bacterium]